MTSHVPASRHVHALSRHVVLGGGGGPGGRRRRLHWGADECRTVQRRTEGTEAGYQSYLDLMPSGLRDRLQHVPANQEIRWDESSYENYEDHLGALDAEATVGGVQFLLLDATRSVLCTR